MQQVTHTHTYIHTHTHAHSMSHYNKTHTHHNQWQNLGVWTPMNVDPGRLSGWWLAGDLTRREQSDVAWLRPHPHPHVCLARRQRQVHTLAGRGRGRCFTHVSPAVGVQHRISCCCLSAGGRERERGEQKNGVAVARCLERMGRGQRSIRPECWHCLEVRQRKRKKGETTEGYFFFFRVVSNFNTLKALTLFSACWVILMIP